MLVQLLTCSVLVIKVVDSVEEGWLRLLVRTVEVKSFRLVIANRVRLAIVERIVVACQVIVVERPCVDRLRAVSELVPQLL